METAEPQTKLREIVGVFRSIENVEAAVSELCSAGWDRSELSLLAQHKLLMPESVPATTHALATKGAHQAVVSDTDVRQVRTLAAGTAGVVGALLAAGATIVTGGTALAAIIGASLVGGGAIGLVEATGKRADDNHQKFLQEQIDQGGILLWVNLRDDRPATKACDILQQCGAFDVKLIP